eukprot:Phypoly_transcript_22669.p1 GENE.Phypoly_transcript_22669~~Phypoly_transcript_22669.p1  ORF type:complete len:173 (+),score=50.46 Phypoly_transcript_22669:42-560(+)
MLEEVTMPDSNFQAIDLKSQERETVDPTAKQKVEEEIEKKKEILQKLVKEKVSKTREDMAMLNRVKTDLEKIDLMIDQDVVILRSKIDSLAVEVSQAQSHMAKKEKEYLQAKQVYEKKFNDKKMLTDHLNLIILENEKKKEYKLAEMMEKLGVTNDEFSGWEGFKDDEPSKT